MNTYYSSCCGEEINLPQAEIEICPCCGEWCEVIKEEEES